MFLRGLNDVKNKNDSEQEMTDHIFEDKRDR
jgi:hypothetical protein